MPRRLPRQPDARDIDPKKWSPHVVQALCQRVPGGKQSGTVPCDVCRSVFFPCLCSTRKPLKRCSSWTCTRLRAPRVIEIAEERRVEEAGNSLGHLAYIHEEAHHGVQTNRLVVLGPKSRDAQDHSRHATHTGARSGVVLRRRCGEYVVQFGGAKPTEQELTFTQEELAKLLVVGGLDRNLVIHPHRSGVSDANVVKTVTVIVGKTNVHSSRVGEMMWAMGREKIRRTAAPADDSIPFEETLRRPRHGTDEVKEYLGEFGENVEAVLKDFRKKHVLSADCVETMRGLSETELLEFIDQENNERSVFGQTYVQEGLEVGVLSYHFRDGNSYINFQAAPSRWTTEDGTRFPKRQYFIEQHWDPPTKTFQGSISWAPHTVGGANWWTCVMKFDENYTCIEGGELTAYFKKSDGTEDLISTMKYGPNAEADIVYTRWGEDYSSELKRKLQHIAWKSLVAEGDLLLARHIDNWYVRDVKPNGPAYKAGVRRGHMLHKVLLREAGRHGPRLEAIDVNTSNVQRFVPEGLLRPTAVRDSAAHGGGASRTVSAANHSDDSDDDGWPCVLVFNALPHGWTLTDVESEDGVNVSGLDYAKLDDLARQSKRFKLHFTRMPEEVISREEFRARHMSNSEMIQLRMGKTSAEEMRKRDVDLLWEWGIRSQLTIHQLQFLFDRLYNVLAAELKAFRTKAQEYLSLLMSKCQKCVEELAAEDRRRDDERQRMGRLQGRGSTPQAATQASGFSHTPNVKHIVKEIHNLFDQVPVHFLVELSDSTAAAVGEGHHKKIQRHYPRHALKTMHAGSILLESVMNRNFYGAAKKWEDNQATTTKAPKKKNGSVARLRIAFAAASAADSLDMETTAQPSYATTGGDGGFAQRSDCQDEDMVGDDVESIAEEEVGRTRAFNRSFSTGCLDRSVSSPGSMGASGMARHDNTGSDAVMRFLLEEINKFLNTSLDSVATRELAAQEESHASTGNDLASTAPPSTRWTPSGRSGPHGRAAATAIRFRDDADRPRVPQRTRLSQMDGRIFEKDFCDFLITHGITEFTKDEAREKFKAMDTDGNGYLTINEVLDASSRMHTLVRRFREYKQELQPRKMGGPTRGVAVGWKEEQLLEDFSNRFLCGDDLVGPARRPVILDAQITASSNSEEACRSRMDSETAWVASLSDKKKVMDRAMHHNRTVSHEDTPWIQWAFGGPRIITAIETQGNAKTDGVVTEWQLMYIEPDEEAFAHDGRLGPDVWARAKKYVPGREYRRPKEVVPSSGRGDGRRRCASQEDEDRYVLQHRGDGSVRHLQTLRPNFKAVAVRLYPVHLSHIQECALRATFLGFPAVEESADEEDLG